MTLDTVLLKEFSSRSYSLRIAFERVLPLTGLFGSFCKRRIRRFLFFVRGRALLLRHSRRDPEDADPEDGTANRRQADTSNCSK